MSSSTLSDPEKPNVLLFVRPDLMDQPGGDTVQVLATAEALRQAGAGVTISSDPELDLSDFDCVHLFHLERVHETGIYLEAAKGAQKPVALSPIYWPPDGCPRPAALLRGRRLGFWREEAKNLVRLALARGVVERRAVTLALRKGFARCRRELLEGADVLLPNSQAEAELIAAECSRPARLVVTPNVIDARACRAALSEPAGTAREGVICVGHFDPRKNQLGLIEALRGTGVRVEFVGGPRRMHRRYYRRCVGLAGDQHRFVGPVPHGEILRHMRRARVHVCPSHFETPGLVNLEAGAMGCVVVAPDCAPVREYLQSDAVYFRPGDGDSLRSAVLGAMERSASESLARRIEREYGLEALAQSTLGAYAMIVSSPHRSARADDRSGDKQG